MPNVIAQRIPAAPPFYDRTNEAHFRRNVELALQNIQQSLLELQQLLTSLQAEFDGFRYEQTYESVGPPGYES